MPETHAISALVRKRGALVAVPFNTPGLTAPANYEHPHGIEYLVAQAVQHADTDSAQHGHNRGPPKHALLALLSPQGRKRF